MPDPKTTSPDDDLNLFEWLAENTGHSVEELLRAGSEEFARMEREGLITRTKTPFGDLVCLRHPILSKGQPHA